VVPAVRAQAASERIRATGVIDSSVGSRNGSMEFGFDFFRLAEHSSKTLSSP
jgi:hypothetical protein